MPTTHKCTPINSSLFICDFKCNFNCNVFSLSPVNSTESEIINSAVKRPNPNNPMEYCSTIPPLLQVDSAHHPTPSVLVPKVGVLKREGKGTAAQHVASGFRLSTASRPCSNIDIACVF